MDSSPIPDESYTIPDNSKIYFTDYRKKADLPIYIMDWYSDSSLITRTRLYFHLAGFAVYNKKAA
jgi:hypothetical protein